MFYDYLPLCLLIDYFTLAINKIRINYVCLQQILFRIFYKIVKAAKYEEKPHWKGCNCRNLTCIVYVLMWQYVCFSAKCYYHRKSFSSFFFFFIFLNWNRTKLNDGKSTVCYWKHQYILLVCWGYYLLTVGVGKISLFLEGNKPDEC